MHKILTLNPISDKIFTVLSKDKYTVANDIKEPDAILVRSADMHSMTFGSSLKCVARAGAGVNNIPLVTLAERGIPVFNTPGANANAVKELVLCGMLLASRDIIGGIAWAKTLTSDVAKTVEKGKNKFGGTEIFGKTLGVVGLGAIGKMVASSALALGMKVVGYDPYVKTLAGIEVSSDINKLLSVSDYVTLHVPYMDSTKGMINKDSIKHMKKGATLLNMARAELVNASALKEALSVGALKNYVVDFPTEEVLGQNGVIAIPHLGASTEEAEDNCAIMAAQSIVNFLEKGELKNCVNNPKKP